MLSLKYILYNGVKSLTLCFPSTTQVEWSFTFTVISISFLLSLSRIWVWKLESLGNSNLGKWIPFIAPLAFGIDVSRSLFSTMVKERRPNSLPNPLAGQKSYGVMTGMASQHFLTIDFLMLSTELQNLYFHLNSLSPSNDPKLDSFCTHQWAGCSEQIPL